MLYRAVLEQWCDVRVTARRRVDFSLCTGELPQMSLIDHHRIKLQDVRFFTYEIRIRYKAISTFWILNASVKDGMRDQPCHKRMALAFHTTLYSSSLFHTCISCNLERYIIDGVQNFLSWIGFLYYTDFLINYRILRKARLFIRQLIMDIPIIFNCYHVSISKRNSDRNINKFKFTSLEAPIHY